MATVPNGKLFSCGNHSTETTKGMLYFGVTSQIICMFGVPTTMTARDVLQFLGPSLEQIENTRVVREVNHESAYMVLLKFRTLDSAQDFYLNHDGVPFNSLEDNKCKLLYITRIETFAEDPAKIEESSNCAVCLDQMYAEVESLITILCNHSFHVPCLSKWSDTTCPVCRYCQTPESQIESKCMDCAHEGESLWMCIICGYVACGRYINGHAYEHFTRTQHTYAMRLTDNQVWDYVGDNYVHRLLANKSDGKPVEVEGAEAYRQAEEKIEAVQLEYTYLLAQQLESQRKYYEKLLKDCDKQCQKKMNDATNRHEKVSEELLQLQDKCKQVEKDKAALDRKLITARAKLTKMQAQLNDEKQMNICLTLKQEQSQKKFDQIEKELNEKKNKITELEEQQRDLLFYFEAKAKIDKAVSENMITRPEMDDSQIVMQQKPSTSSRVSRNNRKTKN